MKRLRVDGFTLTEVLITLVVTSIVMTVLLALVMNGIVNYGRTEARASLQAEVQTALNIIGTDIRLSGSVDQNNRWPDENAPDAPADLFSWESNNQQVILATAAEDSDNNVLFADPAQYISHKNNTIYFVRDGVLYKRVLASDVTDNSALTSCPQDKANDDCPADQAMLQDVTGFSVRYFDSEDNEVPAANARSVEVNLQSTVQKYGHDITVGHLTRTVFRND